MTHKEKRALKQKLERRLVSFQNKHRALPGVQPAGSLESLVLQIIDSLRRVEFIHVVREMHLNGRLTLSDRRADPRDTQFDPHRAAILKQAAGEVDEAFWLIFLSVHFGKNGRSGWQLVRDVYGRLGHGAPWTWRKVSRNPTAFRTWLHGAQSQLKTQRGGPHRAFGNHRKYTSLDAKKPNATGHAVESYVEWIGPSHSHRRLIDDAQNAVGANPRDVFRHLYKSMSAVASFGRIGRFDYLTMIGNIGLAQIEPDSPCLVGATGPAQGAALLFRGSGKRIGSRQELDEWVVELGDATELQMNILEDALCNWQKSPTVYRPFRG